MKGTPAAIPWYETEESYTSVVAMLPASEAWEALSYDAFIEKVKGLEKQMKGQGLITYRVPIDGIAVKAWCETNNRPVCRETITAYITGILGLRLRRESGTS